MIVQYYKDNHPIQVEWIFNKLTDELYLSLNGKVEPLIIELKPKNGTIRAKYKGKVYGSARVYELGILKKQMLKDIYQINYKYRK